MKGTFLSLLLLSFATATLTPRAAAQCSDPILNGQIIEHLDLEVLFTDGYRTLMDVRFPEVIPGACGWPTIVFVHGSGSNKNSGIASRARQAALRGYAAITYDVRGQGPSRILNDPNVYGVGPQGLRERLDLFEVMEAAEALFPEAIDFDRLAVGGTSQGGIHAWFAAALSGQLPPPNPWRAAPFPSIRCAAAHNAHPQYLTHVFPEERAVNDSLIRLFWDPAAGVHFQPDFFADVTPMVLSEDYEGLAAYLDVLDLDLLPQLTSSTVPVMATLAYDDDHWPPNEVMAIWDSLLAPGTEKFINLTTGGHGSQNNQHENELRIARERLFFDYFLKNECNGCDLLPPIRMAIMPDDLAMFQDPFSLWDFRHLEEWPPQNGVAQEQWYLADGNSLVPMQPSGPSGPGNPLSHAGLQVYSLEDYKDELPAPEDLQTIFPLQSVEYDTPPIPADQLLCACAAQIWVNAPETPFQVQAAVFDVDELDNERYIAAGGTTRRAETTPGDIRLDLDIGLHGYVLRAGHRLRLRVETQIWHRPPALPAQSEMRALPVFGDFDLTVLHGSDNPSFLEITFIPFGDPTLAASEVEVPRDGGPNVTLAVRADSSRAGWDYTMLFGGTGSTPGSTFNGVHVDLNQDSWTQFFLENPNTEPAVAFQGTLDSDGNAFPEFHLCCIDPIPSDILSLGFVAVINSPDNLTVQASNAIQIPIRPDPVLLGSLEVEPQEAFASVGDTVQYTAYGVFENGARTDFTDEVEWSSSKPNVATIDANGLATCHKRGRTNITATMDGVTKKVVLRVLP